MHTTADPARLPPARALLHAGHGRPVHDLVVLTWEERVVFSRDLTTVHDETFAVSMPQPMRLSGGDAFELADGRVIEVIEAEEPLMELIGPTLAEAAWRLGNRHVPVQAEPGRLLTRPSQVVEDVIAATGVTAQLVSEPFVPVWDTPHHHTEEMAHRLPFAARGAGLGALVDHELPTDGPFGPD